LSSFTTGKTEASQKYTLTSPHPIPIPPQQLAHPTVEKKLCADLRNVDLIEL
jgi:hypothetical protein